MLEAYYSINQAIGVNINITSNGDIQINACGVIVEGQSLRISKKFIGLTNVEELIKQLPSEAYVALNIVGKGILTKPTAKTDQIVQNNFLQLLPNSDLNDFYVQNFISGDRSFVSVIRRSEADKWLSLLSKQQVSTLTLTLGPFAVENVLQQLNVYDLQFEFDGHSIQRDEQNNWISYVQNPKSLAKFPLKIETESIDQQLVIPYATAFQLVLANRIDPIVATVPKLAVKFQGVIANKKIRVKGIVMLLVTFLLLLINFFLFSFLNNANSNLNTQLRFTAQNTNDYQDVLRQVQDKEILLKSLGWDYGINKSSLIDQLAALLPPEVWWQEFNITPLTASNGLLKKDALFIDGEIKIIGTSEKIIPVNEWIARIKTKKWVKQIQMDSYTFNTELNTGQFIVIINY